MIKNIVFDLGNVVFKGRHKEMLEGFNISKEDVEKMEIALFQTEDWLKIDLGVITFEEAYLAGCSRLPKEFHSKLKEILDVFSKERKINEEIFDIMQKLKAKKYNIYILSNNNVKTYEFLKKSKLDNYIDGYIISALVHAVKPEKEIYNILFDTFLIKPEESFFVDDMEINIKVGEELGMPGCVLDLKNDGTTKLLEKFKKYQIEI